MLFRRKGETNNAPPPGSNAPSTPAETGAADVKWRATKADRLVIAVVLFFLAAVILVSVMFGRLIANYRSNTARESTAHLTEINADLRLYVEAKIDGYWNATHSIANSVTSANLGADESILEYLLQERDIWDVSRITLYTESGYTLSTDGNVIANDVASETISNATRVGEYLTIMESTIIFVVPVDTADEYNGSRIVAVSVVQDLSSFLDNMGISSFGGTGFLYLTQKDGTVVSKQTREGSYDVYNLLPLLEESIIQPLSDNMSSMDDILTSESCSVFLRKTGEGDQYIVSSPIETGYEEMRLFYFVPVNVVNETANSFSHYILMLSIIIILAFAIGAGAVFFYLYKARKRQFDKELAVREHMLDLLVQNSKSAFALLSINQSEPRFVSGNGYRIIGEKYYNLEKTGSGYRMRGSSGIETDAIGTLNGQLRDWDGTGEFRSAFIRNTAAAVPSYFEIQLFPLAKSGQQGDFIAIAQDVTPLYERQAATAEALAMAEQANSAKTRFLSNMSHDIRTPMNAIVNMTDFAIDSIGDPETQLEYLGNLKESSAHLLQLINDVLDMSRIESGRMVIASEPFDLRAELDRIADIVRPLSAQKGQRFTADFSRIKTSAVLGDQVKLSQIFMNLLSNATKFTPEGGDIRFTAEELPSLRENVVNIRFEVEDTGIGIAPNDMQSIFEPFSRVDNDSINRIEGTGLGLSICRSYVKAMCGTLRCDSREGKGSVFTVELFFQTAGKATEKHAEVSASGNVPFAGRRCLVCEDNKLNRTIATKILQQLGFAVETAADGKEGADKFTESPPGYYDVIYMDVQMPVMDGYHATAAIRKSAHPEARTVPIIAMTANVFAEDVERARAAGMNGHLGKPILVQELTETTNAILKSKGE